ncbi:MAG: hypothetical protein AB2693_20585 [Candidatus Thiodiazotropha sp.]
MKGRGPPSPFAVLAFEKGTHLLLGGQSDFARVIAWRSRGAIPRPYLTATFCTITKLL